MRGMLLKILHEVWLPTLLFGLGLFLINALLTHVLPQVMQGMGEIFAQFPFVKSLITALLGTEVGDEITAHTMQAFSVGSSRGAGPDLGPRNHALYPDARGGDRPRHD